MNTKKGQLERLKAKAKLKAIAKENIEKEIQINPILTTFKIQDFFNKIPDRTERLVSCIQYCSSRFQFNSNQTNIDPEILCPCLDKGIFYRGLSLVDSNINKNDTLQDNIDSILEKFEEFNKVLIKMGKEVIITKYDDFLHYEMPSSTLPNPYRELSSVLNRIVIDLWNIAKLEPKLEESNDLDSFILKDQPECLAHYILIEIMHKIKDEIIESSNQYLVLRLSPSRIMPKDIINSDNLSTMSALILSKDSAIFNQIQLNKDIKDAFFDNISNETYLKTFIRAICDDWSNEYDTNIRNNANINTSTISVSMSVSVLVHNDDIDILGSSIKNQRDELLHGRTIPENIQHQALSSLQKGLYDIRKREQLISIKNLQNDKLSLINHIEAHPNFHAEDNITKESDVVKFKDMDDEDSVNDSDYMLSDEKNYVILEQTDIEYHVNDIISENNIHNGNDDNSIISNNSYNNNLYFNDYVAEDKREDYRKLMSDKQESDEKNNQLYDFKSPKDEDDKETYLNKLQLEKEDLDRYIHEEKVRISNEKAKLEEIERIKRISEENEVLEAARIAKEKEESEISKQKQELIEKNKIAREKAANAALGRLAIENEERLRNVREVAEEEERLKIAREIAIENEERLRIVREVAEEEEERLKIAREIAEEEEERLRNVREIAEEKRLRIVREIAEEEERLRIAREIAEEEEEERIRIAREIEEEEEERIRIAREIAEEEERLRIIGEIAEEEERLRIAREIAEEEEEEERLRIAREIAEEEERLRIAREIAEEEERIRIAREIAEEEEILRIRIAREIAEEEEERRRIAREIAEEEERLRIIGEIAEEEEERLRIAREIAEEEERLRIAREIAEEEEEEERIRIAREIEEEEEERLRIIGDLAEEDERLRIAREIAEEDERLRIVREVPEEEEERLRIAREIAEGEERIRIVREIAEEEERLRIAREIAEEDEEEEAEEDEEEVEERLRKAEEEERRRIASRFKEKAVRRENDKKERLRIALEKAENEVKAARLALEEEEFFSFKSEQSESDILEVIDDENEQYEREEGDIISQLDDLLSTDVINDDDKQWTTGNVGASGKFRESLVDDLLRSCESEDINGYGLRAYEAIKNSVFSHVNWNEEDILSSMERTCESNNIDEINIQQDFAINEIKSSISPPRSPNPWTLKNYNNKPSNLSGSSIENIKFNFNNIVDKRPNSSPFPISPERSLSSKNGIKSLSMSPSIKIDSSNLSFPFSESLLHDNDINNKYIQNYSHKNKNHINKSENYIENFSDEDDVEEVEDNAVAYMSPTQSPIRENKIDYSVILEEPDILLSNISPCRIQTSNKIRNSLNSSFESSSKNSAKKNLLIQKEMALCKQLIEDNRILVNKEKIQRRISQGLSVLSTVKKIINNTSNHISNNKDQGLELNTNVDQSNLTINSKPMSMSPAPPPPPLSIQRPPLPSHISPKRDTNESVIIEINPNKTKSIRPSKLLPPSSNKQADHFKTSDNITNPPTNLSPPYSPSNKETNYNVSNKFADNINDNIITIHNKVSPKKSNKGSGFSNENPNSSNNIINSKNPVLNNRTYKSRYSRQDEEVNVNGYSRGSNQQQIRNALNTVCLAGVHFQTQRKEALETIDTLVAAHHGGKGLISPITHFIVLFFHSKCLSFRGLYSVTSTGFYFYIINIKFSKSNISFKL
jgi:hypothetical protein